MLRLAQPGAPTVPKLTPVALVPSLRVCVCLCAVLSSSGNTPAGASADRTVRDQGDWVAKIDTADLKRHCSVLAADSFEGRAAGTRGGQAAAAYLIAEFRKLKLEPAGEDKDYRQPFGLSYANILARIPGSDPILRDELIVLGAHYDHVGYGNSQNSFGPLGQVHNGADDNASGTAVVLEIAQALMSRGAPPRRSILLALWDAEEAGLLGSEHWVKQDPSRRAQVKLAINLDMVGRMQHDRVMVMGWRSAAGLRQLLAEHNGAYSLAFQFEPRVTADSDHYSFYAGQIPVLHFDTGKHPDYHRPTDDVEKLNWDGMQRLGHTIARLVATAADAPSLPRFRLESWREGPAPTYDPQLRKAPPVRLGVSWNPRELAKGNVEVLDVAAQSPAAQAGLRKGDRLVQFAGWKEGTFADLRAAITTAPAHVAIAWRRPGSDELLTATVALQGEPVRCGLVVAADPALPQTLTITHVVDSSPADLAGLQPGDNLLQWGDAAVGSAEELARRVQSDVGPVRLLVEREGRLAVKRVDLPPR